MKLIHGTFYGTKVAVYNVTISKIRKTNDYNGLDYIFQTNEQLTDIYCFASLEMKIQQHQ